MVVVEDGIYAVADDMVRLASAKVNREKRMHYGEYQEVELRSEKGTEAKRDSTASRAVLVLLLVGFRGRKIWLRSG